MGLHLRSKGTSVVMSTNLGAAGKWWTGATMDEFLVSVSAIEDFLSASVYFVLFGPIVSLSFPLVDIAGPNVCPKFASLTWPLKIVVMVDPLSSLASWIVSSFPVSLILSSTLDFFLDLIVELSFLYYYWLKV